MGRERMIMSQVSGESLGRGPPSEGPWLRAVKNSRASHSKVKAEIHFPWAECSLSQSTRAALGETHHRQSVGLLRR